MSEVSQWTIETLREYLIALIDANDKRYQKQLEALRSAMETTLIAQKEAMNKADIAAEKRFESINEFRSVLSNQQATLMPRPETLALFQAMEDKMAAQLLAHEKNMDFVIKSINDLQLSDTHLLSIESYETRHAELQTQINDLREYRSEHTGKALGANALWGYIVAIAGIALALVFHFIK